MVLRLLLGHSALTFDTEAAASVRKSPFIALIVSAFILMGTIIEGTTTEMPLKETG